MRLEQLPVLFLIYTLLRQISGANRGEREIKLIVPLPMTGPTSWLVQRTEVTPPLQDGGPELLLSLAPQIGIVQHGVLPQRRTLGLGP